MRVRHEHIVLFFGAGHFPVEHFDEQGVAISSGHAGKAVRTRADVEAAPPAVANTRPFLVTEYCHNGSLGSVLHSDHPLPWSLRLKVDHYSIIPNTA
jgi:hypothetical protein